MALSKFTGSTSNIQDLSDTPNQTEGLTADQLKKKFDDYGIENKTYINEVLTVELDTALEIASQAEAEAGTDNIKKMTALRTKQAISYISALNGWIPAGVTFTYASANTITTSASLVGIVGIGDKIKVTQGGVTKFYYIVANPTSTTLTVTGGSDYVVANTEITNPYYSHIENPYGFPQWFNYTSGISGLTVGNGTLATKFNIKSKIVTISIKFDFGSTSAITGFVKCNLPVSNFSLNNSTGSIYIFDLGTGYTKGTSVITNELLFYIDNVGGTYTNLVSFSSTVPITWASGDSFSTTISYGIV